MLDARRDTVRAKRIEAMLKVLARYRVGDLIQHAIQAGYVTGLEDLEGSLTLLSTLSPLEAVRPPYAVGTYGVLTEDGHNGSRRELKLK